MTPKAVLPLGGAPANLPHGGGFDTFAVVQPGVLTRSGTPDAHQFDYLRAAGWRSIVDVRTTDDRTYSGFDRLGLRYLFLPVVSGGAPTDDQALSFLCFVTDTANQPVAVHDNSGRERVGVLVALYRYSVQAWPMSAALAEEAGFGDELSAAGIAFLDDWAARHPPGQLLR
jgi:protein tyrosine/serine phosphatase